MKPPSTFGSSIHARQRCGIGRLDDSGRLTFCWALEIEAEPVSIARVVIVVDCFSARPIRAEDVSEVLARLMKLGVHQDAPVGIFRAGDPVTILPWIKIKDWSQTPNVADALRRRELLRPAASFAGFVATAIEAAEREHPDMESTIAFVLGDGDFVDSEPRSSPRWRWFRVGEFGDSKPSPRLLRVLPSVASFSSDALSNVSPRLTNAMLCACQVDIAPRSELMLIRSATGSVRPWPLPEAITHDFRCGPLTIFGRGPVDPHEVKIRVSTSDGEAMLHMRDGPQSDSLASEAMEICQGGSEVLSLSDARLLGSGEVPVLRSMLLSASKLPFSSKRSGCEDHVLRRLFTALGVRAVLVVESEDKVWVLDVRGSAGPWQVYSNPESGALPGSNAMTIRLSEAHGTTTWIGEWEAEGFRQDIGFYAATIVKRPVFSRGDRPLTTYFVARAM